MVYKFGGGGPASAMAAMPSSLASTWADGWAGPYFGVYFGAGAGVARGDYAGIIDISTIGTITQNALLAGTTTGMQTDLFAGYNLRSDRLVVGGQVEATQFSDVAAKMAGTQTSVNSTSVQNSIFDQSERLRSMVSVVGRAGFLATPNLLLYGLGGLALGHFKYPDGGDRFPDPNGKWVAGYTVGAGGELKVARHWSLRTEYRYLHFDIERGASYGTFTTAGGPTTFSFASRTSTDFHLGKVGLVYRIGEDFPRRWRRCRAAPRPAAIAGRASRRASTARAARAACGTRLPKLRIIDFFLPLRSFLPEVPVSGPANWRAISAAG